MICEFQSIERRVGNQHFFPFGSLSIGAVSISAEFFANHHEVAGAMSHAKTQAKNRWQLSIY